jgi:hypothetical protein
MTRPAAIVRRYETRTQVGEYPSVRGVQCTPEGWRNGRWFRRDSRDDGGFWVTVWPRNAPHSNESVS